MDRTSSHWSQTLAFIESTRLFHPNVDSYIIIIACYCGAVHPSVIHSDISCPPTLPGNIFCPRPSAAGPLCSEAIFGGSAPELIPLASFAVAYGAAC